MLRRAAGIGAMGILALALAPAPVHADTYRYWSYWTGGDQWSYSARGPGFRSPPDGGVEGWRFVVSPRDGSQATPPATASDFAQLCPGAAPAPTGQKRVAVVIDSGPAGIAPVGESPPATSTSCVTVPAGANGLQVLQKVSRLRFHSSGLICGIAGFPASECPGQSRVTATPTATTPAASVPPVTAPETVEGPGTVTDDTDPGAAATPTPTPTRVSAPSDTPTPVALAVPEQPGDADSTAVPPWVAAIGAAMIAALLGLALLARRGRE